MWLRNTFILIVAITAISISACAESPKQKEQEKKLSNLETELSNIQNILSQLTKNQTEEQSKIYEIMGEIAVIKTKIAQITAKQSSLETPISPTEPGRKVDIIIGRLKRDEISSAEAARQIDSVGKIAVPYLWELLLRAKSTKDLDLSNKLEETISRLPSENIKTFMIEALKDEQLRVSAARIIGNVRDNVLSKELEPYINDNDSYFRFIVGDALTKCKNKAGIPILIDALKNDKEVYNIIAFDILSKVTKNNFGYKIFAPTKENQKAIELWEEWWKGAKETFKIE